ncbi:MAG: hypothetical protein HYW02_05230 [Deltaproteobacteria bacterium]|nr:hypothetical protein [Deltaproteobacteria bacterium]
MDLTNSANPELAELQWKELRTLLGPSFKEDRFHPLLSLLGNSRFLVDFLLRHPEIIKKNLIRKTFSARKTEGRMKQEISTLLKKGFRNDDISAQKILRLYKYSEFVRITVRDLSALASFEEIGLELSSLANALIDGACWSAFRILGEKSVQPPPFSVIGLGKLGGDDLNFSSDIDILYLYLSGKGAKKGSSFRQEQEQFEFFAKRSELITRLLQERSDEGICFRVDLDLRPEGRNGPIVNSIDALEKYYEIRGAVWERLAWIKGKHAAGDARVSRDCLKRLTPFVYPRTANLSAIQEIRKMKERINTEVERLSTGSFHLKLGRGGIREIEFFVSAFQLLYGGREPKLRKRNTLDSLRVLKGLSLLPAQEENSLREAYIFFRRLENRLQMREEQQLHSLPSSQKEISILSRQAGYNEPDRFLEQLHRHQREVAACFERLAGFGAMAEARGPVISHWNELNQEISAESDLEERLEILRRFKRSRLKRIEDQDEAGRWPLPQLFRELTIIAETILRGGHQIAWEELSRKITPPEGPFAVLAMGKFGGKELNYFSDLDLIFLLERPDEMAFYTKLSERIISAISLLTAAGRAYSIDTRLRPSGRAGTLVSTLDSFEEYHHKFGRIWERQALIKARPVLGEENFIRKVEQLLDKLIYEEPLSQDPAPEIYQLRMRMEQELAKESPGHYEIKLGRGGLVDIEFLVQYLQLLHGREERNLRKQNTLEALTTLQRGGILNQKEGEFLQNTYLYLRELETRIRLFFSRESDTLIENADWLSQLENRYFNHSIIDRFLSCREKTRAIFEKYLHP